MRLQLHDAPRTLRSVLSHAPLVQLSDYVYLIWVLKSLAQVTVERCQSEGNIQTIRPAHNASWFVNGRIRVARKLLLDE